MKISNKGFNSIFNAAKTLAKRECNAPGSAMEVSAKFILTFNLRFV